MFVIFVLQMHKEELINFNDIRNRHQIDKIIFVCILFTICSTYPLRKIKLKKQITQKNTYLNMKKR